MKWVITDSGLGGLSVCAGIEQVLTKNNSGAGIDLLYINATPEDRSGYNALPNQNERVLLFDRFLKAIHSRYQPDEIAIACNTLSVIYDDTDFAHQNLLEVRGIVDAGVELCNQHIRNNPEHGLIIFATETTTEAGTYPRLIDIDSSKLSAQECPELAHAISNDASGATCRDLLKDYILDSLQRFEVKPHRVYAFLGCTHYGYQARIFTELIKQQGVAPQILNPNDLLVEQLTSGLQAQASDNKEPLSIKFISRYEIPQVEIQSMERYLKDAAPMTMRALHNQLVVPDLFQSPS